MKKVYKKWYAVLLCTILMFNFSIFLPTDTVLINELPVSASVNSSCPFPIAWQQGNTQVSSGPESAERQRQNYLSNEAVWYNYPWLGSDGTAASATVGSSACSVLSLVNVIYYKTRHFVNPRGPAQYALDKGYRKKGQSGVTTPDFFASYIRDYGTQYGMSYSGYTTNASSALEHVRNGGAISSCISGHWIAIVDYNTNTGRYLMLDSSAVSKRTNNISSYWTDKSNGVAWVPASIFTASPKSQYYGFNGNYSIKYSFSSPLGCTCSDTSMAGKYIINDPDGYTNVRKYENSSSEIVTTLTNGTEVTVTKGSGNWYYIEEYGGHCYASKLSKKGQTPIVNDGVIYIVTTKSSNLNIRNTPSTGDIIGKAPKGAEVVVYDIKDGWAYLNYNGIVGYGSSAYLTKKSTENMTTPTISTDKNLYNVGDTVNISWVSSSPNSDIDHYWLIIYGPDGTILNEDMKLNTSYSFVPSKAGSYTLTSFATPHNSPDGSGSLTDTITINVENPRWYENTSPVDVGTEFYAYIINVEPWLHIANNNGNVETQSPNNTKEQIWRFRRNVNGSYRIENASDGKSLDVYNTSSESGTNVQTYESWEENPAQEWYIYGESGNYTFRPACSDCVLDVAGALTEPGANVQIYTKNGSYAQSFQIWKLETELTVNAGNKLNKTVFNWTDHTGGNIHYSLKIWKDELWVGDAFYGESQIIDCQREVVLPKGHYEAYVDVCVGDMYLMSNVVYFDVEETYFGQSILSVSTGNKTNKTMLSWSTSEGAEYYDIKIWNGLCGDGDAYMSVQGLQTVSYEVALPEGYYEAYIVARSDDNIQKSNIIEFTIEEDYEGLKGDGNLDGKVNVSDLVLLQKWILAKPDTTIECWQNFDMNNDNVLNVFDLCLLKRVIVSK